MYALLGRFGAFGSFSFFPFVSFFLIAFYSISIECIQQRRILDVLGVGAKDGA